MMGSMSAVLMAWLAVAPLAQDGAEDRLYGRVTLASGEVVEGIIRWDLNEGSWTDILNGSKPLSDEDLEEARRLAPEGIRDRSVEFMGVRITWEKDQAGPTYSDSGVRFGHIRTLRAMEGHLALLELKNGEEIELRGGSTDIGPDVRGIEVAPATGMPLELEWEDVGRIDFMAAPPGFEVASPRLYGTLEDRWGQRFTGYVSWDLDEILGSDVLDGEDESGVEREIPFGEIAAVERFGSRSARVTLRNGEEWTLSGSNDVDRGNRGIQISDPGLGQVQVYWEEFESLRLHPPERPTTFDDFDGGSRLTGTVYTEDGEAHSGRIRWDNDEKWGWDILDGEYRDVVFDVEFAQVARIEKVSSRRVEVTLRDGRVVELTGSNDVGSDNRGIYIERDDGSTVAVDWASFESVDFEARSP